MGKKEISPLQKKLEILKLVDRSSGWGKACNQIQDAADATMTVAQWNAFAERQAADFNKCEGSDFVVFNNQYFDWKEFKSKEADIILAYLSYFTDNQITKILDYFQKEVA